MVATVLFKSNESKVRHLCFVFAEVCKVWCKISLSQPFMNVCQIVVINDIFATVLVHL